MALTPGTRVGPYEITSALGAGAMGEVWRARDTKLNRDVALKVLPDSFASDTERLARFTREAQTLAALNHPNIAAIYGLEDSEGVRALVMELVEGDDLSQRIARGAIPLDDASPIAVQIAGALGAAHEQGIIHRDLKPANIKVRPDGTIKVLDFGLAKAMEPVGSASLGSSQAATISRPTPTRAGVILGTDAYMSPEQARGRPVDKRTDIWAFGVVLFEMLTGTRPFGGEDLTDVLGGVVRLEPNWAALPPDVPQPARTLLHGCLVKDPRKRIADISTALFVLERLGRALDDSDSRLEGHGGSDRPVRRRWRRLAVAGWAAAVAVSALALTLGRFGQKDAPPLIRFPVASSSQIVFGEFTAEPYPAVSPDGSAIAFVANTPSAKNQLFVRTIGAAEPVAIDRAVNVQWPFWSADGRHIGYFAEGRIRRVPAAGGPHSDVAAAVAFGGSWNTGDEILFGTDQGIMGVAAGGGTPHPVTTVDSARGDRSHRFPVFLPGGRRFVFLAIGATSERAGVFVGSLNGGEPRRLLSDVSNAVPTDEGVLFFVRDGSLMAQRFDAEWEKPVGEPVQLASGMPSFRGTIRYAPVSAAAGTLAYREENRPVNQLAVVDRSGRQLSTLGPPGVYASPAWSPDGLRLAVSRLDRNTGGMNLWMIDVARDAMRPLASGPFFESHPVWSADSQRLLFSSTRGGQFAIYESLLSTGGDRPVLGIPGGRVVPHSWSSDQRLLYYTVEDGAGPEGDVWEYSFDTKATRPLVQTAADESQARVSPDGRSVAYASDASGRWEVYLRPLDPTKMTVKVSAHGGTNPVWRADGKEVFYLEVEEETRSAVAVNGWLLAVPTNPGMSPTVGEPRRLFRARWPAFSMNELWTFQADAKGTRFVINAVVSEAESPLNVVLGWRRLLQP